MSNAAKHQRACRAHVTSEFGFRQTRNHTRDLFCTGLSQNRWSGTSYAGKIEITD